MGIVVWDNKAEVSGLGVAYLTNLQGSYWCVCVCVLMNLYG